MEAIVDPATAVNQLNHALQQVAHRDQLKGTRYLGSAMASIA